MKIILLVFIICISALPASAYKEDNRFGETQLTAGEQNSNLHRITNRGIEILKKLKKADDYVNRVQSAGRQVNASALEDLLNSDQKDKIEQEIEKQAAEVRLLTAEPAKLRATPDYAAYEYLANLHLSQQKDKEIARQLSLQLRRRGS